MSDAEAMSHGFATIRKIDRCGMVTVRGDLTSTLLKDVVRKATGVAVPSQGKAQFAGQHGILWMSPDELLVFCPLDGTANAVAKMEAGLKGTHALVADVSDARSVFSVTGDGAREVLAKLTPADVSPGALEAGMIRRSRLAQVPAAFWLAADNTITVICFRSVADYVLDLLSSAATPGSEVGYF